MSAIKVATIIIERISTIGNNGNPAIGTGRPTATLDPSARVFTRLFELCTCRRFRCLRPIAGLGRFVRQS